MFELLVWWLKFVGNIIFYFLGFIRIFVRYGIFLFAIENIVEEELEKRGEFRS